MTFLAISSLLCILILIILTFLMETATIDDNNKLKDELLGHLLTVTSGRF